MATILYWLVAMIVLVVAFAILVRWAQPYATFHPRRGPTPAPPPFTAFEVTTTDGVRLTGWRTEMASGQPVLLYICGNAGNIADRTDLLLGVAASGLSVATFNYRGTGESGGRPSEEGVYRDAEAVYDYLVGLEGVTPGQIVVWGHSIGGVVAGELAQRRACAGVIFESTFRSGRLMGRRMLPLFPVWLLMTYRLDNEAAVEKITVPSLFIHGTEDRVIPKEDSRFLHEHATGPSEIWMVAGADHNDAYLMAGEAFFRRIGAFARKVAGTGVAAPESPSPGP